MDGKGAWRDNFVDLFADDAQICFSKFGGGVGKPASFELAIGLMPRRSAPQQPDRGPGTVSRSDGPITAQPLHPSSRIP
jgi:hypothetical protein